MDNEIWKPISRFNGFYEVSNKGRIRTYYDNNNQYKNDRRDRPKIKETYITHYGYMACTGHFMGDVYCLYIHREIALAFIPNPENKPLVLHKDDDKLNNEIDNLYWGTHKDNHKDRQRNFGKEIGENATNNKIMESDAKRILELVNTDLSQRQIADMYGVDQSTISDIKRGKSWKHLER